MKLVRLNLLLPYLDNQLVLLLEQQHILRQVKLKAQAQVMENHLFVVLVLENSRQQLLQFRDIHLQSTMLTLFLLMDNQLMDNLLTDNLLIEDLLMESLLTESLLMD